MSKIELVNAFRTYQGDCYHSNCISHFFKYHNLGATLGAIEVDEELKHDKQDEVFERWERYLRTYGFKVLGKLNNSNEQWTGSYWIITRLTDI